MTEPGGGEFSQQPDTISLNPHEIAQVEKTYNELTSFQDLMKKGIGLVGKLKNPAAAGVVVAGVLGAAGIVLDNDIASRLAVSIGFAVAGLQGTSS